MRCAYILKSGHQCSREAEPGSKYCWQHQKIVDEKKGADIYEQKYLEYNNRKNGPTLPIKKSPRKIENIQQPQQLQNTETQKIQQPQNPKNKKQNIQQIQQPEQKQQKIQSPRKQSQQLQSPIKQPQQLQSPIKQPQQLQTKQIKQPQQIQQFQTKQNIQPQQIQQPLQQLQQSQSPRKQNTKIPGPPVHRENLVQPKAESVTSNFILPAKSQYTNITNLAYSYAIYLNFKTVTDGKYNSVSIPLLFDKAGMYLAGDELDQLQTGVFFHLVKRATQRLALHTDNNRLVRNKTDLISISLGIPNADGTFDIIETIPLDEERLYTKTQKAKLLLNTTVATLGIPFVALYGAVKGNGRKQISDTYQDALSDKYLGITDTKFFNKGIVSNTGNINIADVHFEFMITNLLFPDSDLKNESYTLWIKGTFIGVQLNTVTGSVIPANTSQISITEARVLSSLAFRDTITTLKRRCTNTDTCMYFEAEL